MGATLVATANTLPDPFAQFVHWRQYAIAIYTIRKRTVYVQHSYCAKLIHVEKSTNITVKVSTALAQEAKVLAARRGTSLSRIVADQLESLVNNDQAYAAARRRALRRLKRGYDLGWESSEQRGALHDRENLR